MRKSAILCALLNSSSIITSAERIPSWDSMTLLTIVRLTRMVSAASSRQRPGPARHQRAVGIAQGNEAAIRLHENLEQAVQYLRQDLVQAPTPDPDCD